MSMVDLENALHFGYEAGTFGLVTIPENLSTDPPSTEWAQIFFLPNTPDPTGLGRQGDDAITGIYQIDLNYPMDEGRANIIAKAEAIRIYFWAGRKFTEGSTSVSILSVGSSQGRRVDQNYRISVSVNWDARISRA